MDSSCNDKTKMIGKALKMVGHLLDREPSEDTLLKEYETCQSEVNNRGNQFWISLSIIISLNLILLTQVGNNIANVVPPLSGRFYLLTVPILGLIMIVINVIFKKWQMRQHCVTNVIYQKMRKLEDITGMDRNWLVYGLDLKNDPSKREKWQKLSHRRKAFIEDLLASYPDLPKYERPHGDKDFGYVLYVLIALWIALIVLVFLIYYLPVFRVWLFN